MTARILAASLLAAIASAASAGDLSLAPAVVQLAGQPGQSTTQRLRLRNDTDLALSFEMEARDVVVRDGKRQMLAPGEIPASIAATAVFASRSIVAPPHTTVTVQVTLTVPPGVRHRAVVALFRGTTRIGDPEAATTVSLGTLFAFTLEGEVSASASDLRVAPQSASGNTSFETTFANEGAEPLVPKGIAVVLDSGGSIVARAPFEARRVLPGERTVLRTEFPGELGPGRYRALATFEYAGRSVTRSATLEIR